MRRDEARQLLEDALTRWRGDATRLGERAGEGIARRVPAARPRHPRGARRARASRRPAGAPAAARRSAAEAQLGSARGLIRGREALPSGRVTLRHGAAGAAQPRPDLRDRPGRGPARVRVLLRDPQAHGSAPVAADPGRRWRQSRCRRARGQHLREMLDELGPTFVKFGQLLSTRPDVVPPDIIAELRALQDDVTPFPFAEVERVIEAELELPVEKLFLSFEETPMAAASIGQVHRAVLPNGKRVAVKVQRPAAPRQIEADLSLLYQAARIAQRPRSRARLHRRPRSGRRVRPLDPPGARLPARGAERPGVPPQLRRPCARPDPARVLDLHAPARADARAPRRPAARRPRARPLHARRAQAPGVPDHRGVDDDDLPARLLPRRPAPGEHPRPRAGADRHRRLRAGRASSATTTCRS